MENIAYNSNGSQQTNWVRDRWFYLTYKPCHLSKNLWRHINTQINQLFNLQYKVYRLPLSIALVPFAKPQSGNQREYRIWGGGRINSLQYFEFGLQYPFQPLAVKSTFKRHLWSTFSRRCLQNVCEVSSQNTPQIIYFEWKQKHAVFVHASLNVNELLLSAPRTVPLQPVPQIF